MGIGTTEIQIKDSLQELKDELSSDWKEVVIDVGSNNKVSTEVGDGTLLVLIDPKGDPNKIDMGDNDLYGQGKIVVVPKDVQDVVQFLARERTQDAEVADRVQIIGPEASDLANLVDSSLALLKTGGDLVVVVDILSDQKIALNDELEEVHRKLNQDKTLGVTLERRGEVDPGELVGGELNSSVIPGEASVLIVNRRL